MVVFSLFHQNYFALLFQIKIMEPTQKISTRKKFLLVGASLVSAITLSRFFPLAKKAAALPEKEMKTVKMLTQDGRLVEIDRNLMASSSQKVTPEELHSWVKK
jgi:hypothetical protein